MSETPSTPPPGSDAALALGCTCAVLDNGHGRGITLADGTVLYWISEDCPLHGRPADSPRPAVCPQDTQP